MSQSQQVPNELAEAPQNLVASIQAHLGLGPSCAAGRGFILANEMLSEVSCRQTHLNAMQWYERGVRTGSVYISDATLHERLFGIMAVFAEDRALGTRLAGSFARFLDRHPPSRVIGQDGRVALKLAQARTHRVLRGLYLAGGANGPKIGTNIIVAVQAHVHGLTVATSAVDTFLRINEVLELPGIYDPKSDTKHL